MIKPHFSTNVGHASDTCGQGQRIPPNLKCEDLSQMLGLFSQVRRQPKKNGRKHFLDVESNKEHNK